ncbi:MAG: pitrilysin family protein [Candidatus Omnitrophota bacterium]
MEQDHIKSHILDNGFIVLTKYSPGGLTAIQISVRAGSASESIYAGSGISHFIEHMVFKGSPETSKGELVKKIKSLGGYINANTGHDVTSYHVCVPDENAREALGFLSAAVMNPGFSGDEAERERSVILNEQRMYEDNPGSRVIKGLFSTAYKTHPYRFPIIGYPERLQALKREDLADYHGKFYVPNNMTVSIVGGMPEADALAAAREVLGGYPRGPAPVTLGENEAPQGGARESVEYMQTGTGYFSIGYHTVAVADSDVFAADVLSVILGYGDGSRLNRRVVKEKELLYSVGASNYSGLYPGLFIISGTGEHGKIRAAVSEIGDEIRRVREEGVSEEECRRAKALVESDYLHDLETVESMARLGAQGLMLTGDPDFAARYVEGVDAVEAGDVNNVARKYLSDSNRSVVFIESPKESNPDDDGGALRHDTTLSGELEPPCVLGRLPAKAAIGDSGEEAGGDKNYEAGIKKKLLTNGIRVLLNRIPGLPLVSVTFAIKGGLLYEPGGLSGLSNITCSMLLKGTGKRDESEIRPFMEKLGGSIRSYSGMNSYGVTCDFMAGDTAAALDLLGDVILDPVFPEDELRKMKVNIQGDIDEDEDRAFSKGMLGLRKGIFGSHPYSRRIIGEKDSVGGMSREDIIEFYNKSLCGGDIVISVAGDFDEDAIMSALESCFGGITGAGAGLVPAVAAGKMKSKNEKTISMPKKEAIYIIGFDGVTVKDEDRYPLEVLFTVMSGGGGRLFDSIRDNLGLSYSQGGSSVEGVQPGYCYFYVASDKGGVEKASAVLLEEIGKLRQDGITDAELTRAKNYLYGAFTRSMQTRRAKSFKAATDELFTLGYDDYLNYRANIMKCTKADVKRVAIKYLDPKRSFSVTVVPEGK